MRILLAVLLAATLQLHSAWAQEPRLSVAGGYSHLGYDEKNARSDDTSGVPHGWEAALGLRVAPHAEVQIVGTGDYYDTRVPSLSVTNEYQQHALLGGVRARVVRLRRVELLGRALVGVINRAVDTRTAGAVVSPPGSNHLAIQLGGGADLALKSWLAVRATLDLRMTSLRDTLLSGGSAGSAAVFGDTWLKQPRISVGLVVAR